MSRYAGQPGFGALTIECQNFTGIVVVVCIKGGTITDVEHEEMASIIADAPSPIAGHHV